MWLNGSIVIFVYVNACSELTTIIPVRAFLHIGRVGVENNQTNIFVGYMDGLAFENLNLEKVIENLFELYVVHGRM